MKIAFTTKYRIMIKSASVEHVLSDDWRALTFREGAYILTVIKAAFEQWCESL